MSSISTARTIAVRRSSAASRRAHLHDVCLRDVCYNRHVPVRRLRMRQATLPLTAFLAVAFLASLAAAPAARAQNPPYTVEVTASRIWTNDDMDRLRAEGLITTFGEPAAN